MPKLSLAKLERHLYSAADRLRQEGLDAATYKDYIFGLLFLKRSSDEFEAERANVSEQNRENPDYYDTFFIPERARWDYLQSKLADAAEPYGGVLDRQHKMLQRRRWRPHRDFEILSPMIVATEGLQRQQPKENNEQGSAQHFVLHKQ